MRNCSMATNAFRPLKRIFKLSLMVGSASIFLSGCVSLSTAYNWADVYILNSVDDHFDLTSAQNESVKKEIKGMFS